MEYVFFIIFCLLALSIAIFCAIWTFRFIFKGGSDRNSHECEDTPRADGYFVENVPSALYDLNIDIRSREMPKDVMKSFETTIDILLEVWRQRERLSGEQLFVFEQIHRFNFPDHVRSYLALPREDRFAKRQDVISTLEGIQSRVEGVVRSIEGVNMSEFKIMQKVLEMKS